MDFFASDVFLTALARDYHRAKTYEFKTYSIEGGQVRLAEASGGRILTTGPFYDYVKSVPADDSSHGTVKYLPRLVTSVVTLDDENPAASVPTSEDVAPLIRWDRFSTWDDYLALLRTRSRNLTSARRKKLRKTTEHFGDPVFTFRDTSVEALDLCVKWKIEQYEGGHETLEDPNALVLLRRMFDEGHLVLATLKVADNYVAVHAGVVWENDYLDILSAYDPAFAVYGVGRELRLRLLECSYRQGHRSYDLLLGAEPYKWDYATHVQLIETYGRPPLVLRARDTLEQASKRWLVALSPRLFYRVKRVVIAARRTVAETTNKIDAGSR
ncbi:GNAT family N-acetyltransferase [uncultured Arthrobacter sp.]|uniref:GNAT family N-acetyltransferase n=1 Tax=uncultured Arthrobacter sp. TaxID=114050 RepID=UPI0026175D6F|nr:GNAT family N-acetyltransferase [uncultured Arthrobacter sp.]